MAKREIRFFATRDDLLPRLLVLEEKRQLIYVKHLAYDRPSIEIIESISDMHELGKNTWGDHSSGSLFVFDKDEGVKVREVRQSNGGVKYFVDPGTDNKSIVFWPGGLYDDDHLICGHVSTISPHPTSQDLFKQFTKEITRGFAKKGSFYIGPHALAISSHTRLITININQPREYDFTI